MKAIILAAGKGERLQPFTKDIPKSLLRIDDQTILENQINHLKKCDIEEINVVVGFAYQKVEQFLSSLNIINIKINTIFNPFWDSTNSLFSLWCARNVLDEDTVLLNGDDVFELEVLRKIISNKFFFIEWPFKSLALTLLITLITSMFFTHYNYPGNILLKSFFLSQFHR